MLFFQALSAPFRLHAQPYYNFYHLTADDGLAQNTVFSLFQDSNHYMWIGAGSKLHRFDGNRLYTYQHEAGNPNSLGYAKIRCIFEDSEGTIWVGTDGAGLSRYQDGQFTTTYVADGQPGSLSNNHVEHIIEMSDGSLYMATWGGGVNIFKDGTFSHIVHNPDDTNSIGSNNVTDLLYDDDTGKLWIGTWEGGLCYQQNGKVFRFPVRPGSFNSTRARTLAKMPDGTIWIGSWGDGLFRYKNGEFTRYEAGDGSIEDNNVLCLITDGNQLWIGTWGGGITLFDGEKFTTFRSSQQNKNSISSDFVECGLIDHAGDLWIGTYAGGVTKFGKTYFNSFQNQYPDQKEISGFIRSITEDQQGRIWMGTTTGIFVLGEERVRPVRDLYPQFPEIASVHSLYKARNGDIWIGGSTGVGLFRFDGRKVYDHTHLYQKDFGKYFISNITQSHDGAIWLSLDVDGGLVRIKGDSVATFLHDPDDDSSLSSSYIYYTLETSDHTLWVGTSRGGLNAWRNGKFTRYQFEEYNRASLSNNTINCLMESSDGSLWIATESGLNRYNPETDGFDHFFASDGLLNDVIMTLAEDDQGYLWIGTHSGISKMDPATLKFQNFDSKSGIKAHPFHRGAVYTCATGEIYMGGFHGLIAFHPDSIRADLFPAVQITNFLIDGQPVPVAKSSILNVPIEKTDKVCLNKFTGSLTFEYSDMSFGLRPESQYSYWLKGFDKDWNYIGRDHSARYSNLPAGSYIFKVRSSTDGLTWSTPESLVVEVIPKWWETTLFRLLGGLLLAGLIAGFVWWRSRYLESQKNRLKKLVNRKTAEIMHQNEQILTNSRALSQANDELQKTLDELKNAQGQLVESEKLATIGILAAGLAHELNNPLNYIGGNVAPIKRDLTEIAPLIMPEKLNDFQQILAEIEALLENMMDGTVKATAIIKNFLAITPHGDHKRWACVNLYAVIDSIVAQTAETYPGLKIEWCEQGNVQIEGNLIEIDQVFKNVIKNAVEAIPEDTSGIIRIKIATHDKMVRVSVSDNGAGITADDLSRLFAPFFTSKSPDKGSGLGLFIAKSIVHKHGGTIDVVSDPALGTTFTISLPAMDN